MLSVTQKSERDSVIVIANISLSKTASLGGRNRVGLFGF